MITWHVNVNSNFVTNVEEFIWNVSVSLKLRRICREEELCFNKKGEEKCKRWKEKKINRNKKFYLREVVVERDDSFRLIVLWKFWNKNKNLLESPLFIPSFITNSKDITVIAPEPTDRALIFLFQPNFDALVMKLM